MELVKLVQQKWLLAKEISVLQVGPHGKVLKVASVVAGVGTVVCYGGGDHSLTWNV